jgi:hypothetical protein
METLAGALSELDMQSGVPGDIQGFVIAISMAILFGVLLYLLYNLYFHDNEPQDGSLSRSLILLTPSLAATFWMIQSSVILSLGLLGTMSFVRFRTPVKRSEDVTFIIMAIATAIACATYNFMIGAGLLGILFAFTLLRNFWTLGFRGKGRFAIVTFNTRQASKVSVVREQFKSVGLRADFVSSRTYDGISSYVFNVPRLSRENHDTLTDKLSELDGNASFNIFYPNDRLGV